MGTPNIILQGSNIRMDLKLLKETFVAINNAEVIAVLKKAAAENKHVWNNWKEAVDPGKYRLSGVDFSTLNTPGLPGYDFLNCTFEDCIFDNIVLFNCDFEHARFERCTFTSSVRSNGNFRSSEFENCTFTETNFINADFRGATFRWVVMENVNFRFACLSDCKFYDSKIIGCKIYGASIWDIDAVRTEQRDLLIPNRKENGKWTGETITIDDIQLGNVIFLLLDNANYRKMFNESKKKSVLILGRFGKNLEQTINPLKNELRKRNLSPIVFDFDKPNALDLMEAIVLLAFMSKFIIADLSDATSVIGELQAILSSQMLPVLPIIRRSSTLFSTYAFTNKFIWIAQPLIYDEIQQVIEKFDSVIIKTAEELDREIMRIKNKPIGTRDINDY
jgi:hypothetical protein